MKTVFSDTFHYLARLSRNDVDRARVAALSSRISAKGATTRSEQRSRAPEGLELATVLASCRGAARMRGRPG
jgi:hypothetical protein